VALGSRLFSRAKYSLPNPYHVQNLLRSLADRLPKREVDEEVDKKKKPGEPPSPVVAVPEETAKAVIVGPESFD
jgi:hypothetical protein